MEQSAELNWSKHGNSAYFGLGVTEMQPATRSDI